MYNGADPGTDYYYHRTPSFDLTKDTIILNPPLLKRGALWRLFAMFSYRGTFPSLISSINASATFGSNWVPLFFSSSPMAYSTLKGSL